MKIVAVHNTYQQPGGEDICFQSERDLLRDAGHEVVEYLRSNVEVEQYRGLIGQASLAKHTIWAGDTRREFRDLLVREKPDIVHVHNTFMMISPSIYWACLEAQVPVVQTLHNYRLLCPGSTFMRNHTVCEECLEHGPWRAVRYGCYRDSRSASAVIAAMLTVHRVSGTWTRAVDHFIATSNFSRGKFVAAGMPRERISVKPNFVYPDPGAKTGIGDYALFVGRLSAEKGVPTLLAAWERLRSPIPLHIIGDGLQRRELEEQARQRGLSTVNFRGQLTRAQTLGAMREARFLVLPSECYENFPMTIAEAFASGTPVLCSRMGAMQDLVEHDRTGLHFTPGDPASLAAQVMWAWERPERLAVMGHEARREYDAKFSAERNIGMLLDIYRRSIHFRGTESKACEAVVAGNA
jgi:glycosyltransferase involved in cell wall biosynthesis